MEYPDHRRLGRELGIFATDEQCGAGLPLWLPAGATVRAELERFIVGLERRNGYQHVYTPALAKRSLYERSGHWQNYHDDMYPPMQVGSEEVVLRPMNCPHHILVFASEPRGAREMPVRLAELGTMFRMERSGVVGGLSRVRQMTLNDGHVFCPVEKIGEEIATILAMVGEAYRALAIPLPHYRLSRRGEGPKYVGDRATWDRSEAMLRESLDAHGLEYEEAEGEAAFYGPKIDLQVQDPQGREETLSTVQVDFHLPGQFDLSFRRGEQLEQPVLIHRSIVSTMERMVAHLLEVHNGALPPWLAPTQVAIIPVADDARDHARRVQQRLHEHEIRVDVDDRDETLASRVRDAQQRRIPYVAVVGRREASDGTVSVRLRDSTQLEPQSVEAFVAMLDQVTRTRASALLRADRSRAPLPKVKRRSAVTARRSWRVPVEMVSHADRRTAGLTQVKDIRVRSAVAEDYTFLATMLGEAAVWRPDKPTPTAHQVLADPRYAQYLAGWPRQGDHGLVAEQEGPVGAAWYRTFTEASHGHGFVAEEVPELAIAVIASRRHEGIGRRLLVDLIAASIAQGYPALSLSVAEHNPARGLYESSGFVPVEKRGSTWTMIRHAAQPS